MYMGIMIINEKMKFLIINSNNITQDTFIYDNDLEEVPSYKYLGIDIYDNLNQNYNIENRINGGWEAYYGFENNCKTVDL